MKRETLTNILFSLFAVILIILIVKPFGAYYFDLNDDVLMKDILSGSYLGKPDGHNIQMLYPLCAIFSILYGFFHGFDWYGFFLCVAQYFCIGILFYQIGSRFEKLRHKILFLLAGSLLFSGLTATHFLFIQYTFTSGLLASTAAALILFHRKNDLNLLLSVLLIWIAYQLRTEMLFLLSPFLCAALTFRFLAGFPYGQRESLPKYLRKYFLFTAITITGMLLLQFMHHLAYRSPDWKQFMDYFNKRTELYDFQQVPPYDGNESLYESLGLKRSEQALLENYNFGLDDKIDANVLEKLASYSASKKQTVTPLSKRIKNSITIYLYRLRHFSRQASYPYPGTDFPWNAVLLLLYVAVILLFTVPKDRMVHFKMPIVLALLVILFLGRSAVWTYIYVRERDPIRITHPLYLIEILILFALFFTRMAEIIPTLNKKTALAIVAGPAILLFLIAAISLPDQLRIAQTENEARMVTNQKYDALYDYFADHPDDFYLLDVYSSVYYLENGNVSPSTYSQRIFISDPITCANYDLLGGWACKSPLSNAKIRGLGFSSMEEALLHDHVYLVQDVSRDTEWIIRYYADKEVKIKLSKIDDIAGTFGIYRLTME